MQEQCVWGVVLYVRVAMAMAMHACHVSPALHMRTTSTTTIQRAGTQQTSSQIVQAQVQVQGAPTPRGRLEETEEMRRQHLANQCKVRVSRARSSRWRRSVGPSTHPTRSAPFIYLLKTNTLHGVFIYCCIGTFTHQTCSKYLILLVKSKENNTHSFFTTLKN